MLTEKVKEHSVVRLVDGRDGTVVHVHDSPGLPLAYIMEFKNEEFDFTTITHDKVEAVLWAPPSGYPSVGAVT